MKIRTGSSSGGGLDAVNVINFVLRALQFLVGLAVLIMYATQPAYKQWEVVYGYNGLKFSLGIAAGAMTLATTPFLALIPFLFGYKPVALAFIWDFIVMVIYAATFAYFENRNRFPYGERGDVIKQLLHSERHISNGRIDVMRAAVSLDLVGMLLWLVSLLMAVGLLVLGRVRGGGRNKY